MGKGGRTGKKGAETNSKKGLKQIQKGCSKTSSKSGPCQSFFKRGPSQF